MCDIGLEHIGSERQWSPFPGHNREPIWDRFLRLGRTLDSSKKLLILKLEKFIDILRKYRG